MATPEKSVLIFTNCFSPNVGGLETHLDDLTRALALRGWQVYVLSLFPLTTRVPWKRHEEIGGVRIWRMWWFGLGWFHVLEKHPPLQFLYLVPRLFWGGLWWLLLHGNKVRVIQAHGLAPALCARLLGPLFRKRLVFCAHSIYGFSKTSMLARVTAWILRPMHAALGLSKESAAELVRAGVPAATTGTFRYWIDLNTFSPGDRAAARQHLQLPGDAAVCLFVGRLIPIKGIRLLLEVSRRPEFAKMTFVFAGVGPLADELARAAAQQSNVRFAGNVANRDLPDYYRAADVLCVPSQYAEGFGRVILEALACGTPVIASDCAGIREATREDVAWLLEPTVENLATVLKGIGSNREELSSKRAICRQFAEERYSSQNVAVIEKALLGDVHA